MNVKLIQSTGVSVLLLIFIFSFFYPDENQTVKEKVRANKSTQSSLVLALNAKKSELDNFPKPLKYIKNVVSLGNANSSEDLSGEIKEKSISKLPDGSDPEYPKAPATEDMISEAFDKHTIKLEDIILNEEMSENWVPGNETDFGLALELLSDQYDSEFHVEETYCGTSLCKTKFSAPDEYGEGEAADDFLAALAWDATSFVVSEVNEDGTVTSVVYFNRDGYEFPKFEFE